MAAGPMKKTHDLIVFDNQSTSLRHLATGEAMHSSIGAWAEANILYVEQSGLAKRLAGAECGPLVLYDIGMGVAANAVAALECRKAVGPTARPLRIVSFENDLTGLSLALEHLPQFSYLAPWAEILKELLQTRRWRSPDGKVDWTLVEGDFLARPILAPGPEVIFYDFYSPKSSPELWTEASFGKLIQAARDMKRCDLYTYSASTSARVALLLSGFFVGKGLTTNAKSETTVASLRLKDLAHPLAESFLKKLRRSDRITPAGCALSREEILDRVLRHPQFVRSDD